MPKDEQTKEEVETLIDELPEGETVVEIPPNIDITDVEILLKILCEWN